MGEWQFLPTDWALAYLLFEWVLRIGFIVLILPHRRPAASRIWLLFGFLTPVLAAIVYALIGRVRHPGRRLEREKRARLGLQQWLGSWSGGEPAASSLERFVSQIGGNPQSSGNEISLLTDYDAVFDELVAAIDAAQANVRLLTYILADDAVGRRVIAALARARARGVEIQVMFDAHGSRKWRKALTARFEQEGIPARACNIYNPIAGGTGRLDRRNHRKIYVIDDDLAFMGSQNLVRRDFRKGIINHEVMVRIAGPFAAELAAQIVHDWVADGGAQPAWPRIPAVPDSASQAQLLATGAGQPEQAYTLLFSRLIQEAEHSALIVSPYIVLDEGLQLAICTAAMRGVEVTLLVSSVVDQPLVHLAQEAGYDPLMAAGITIREFQDGLLHAKYVLIDESRVVVGSSNADIRSFEINSEISLVSEDADLAAKLGRVAQEHLARSQAICPEQWAARPLRKRILQRAAALASPLL